MELSRIKNNTGVPQSIVHMGRQIALGPHETHQFAKEVADKFLENRAPLVSIVEEDLGGTYAEKDDSIMWLANVTGNMDAPDMVKDKRFINKGWSTVDVENPNKGARDLSWMYDPGQEFYTARDGALESRNLFPVKYQIPSFMRRAVKKDVAQWILMRDSTSGPTTRGAVIASRAPAAFEPSMSWSLNDMRAYLRLIDPDAEMVPSEEDVIKEAKKDSRIRQAGDEGLIAAVGAMKRVCYKRLFFRIVDPRYTLPTEAEFREFVTGAPPQEIAAEEVVMGMIEKSEKDVAKTKRRRSKASKEVQPEP